ncbi:hypothetical protein FOZ63_032719 [Perkinsus olseni]|uniref:HTH La-type RNA-binding domain-containing protein n=1 Tax=Perkinsus olseni TaxID=32597 RepID=A0A7J6RRF4_PEROL|nr:hypothetical protein FOZ62_018268 [Perkinsus olseni]KAF4723001.1 hypothetical protein FOZ63_032719 [Perkinsus olseni]
MESNATTPSKVARQIEYYFSEKNLSRDIYLRGLLEGPEGLPLSTLVRFPLLQQQCATHEEVASVVEKVCSSSRYVELSPESVVRSRPSGLPPFEWPKNPRDACGGVMLLTPIPDCSTLHLEDSDLPGSSWSDGVAKAVKRAVEDTVGHEVEYVLPHYPSERCAVLLKPFPRDRAICRSFLKVGPLANGLMLPIEIAYSHTRRQYLMMMPSSVRKEGQVRKRVKVDRPKMAKPTKHIRIRDAPKFTQAEDLGQAERWKLDGYLQFDEPDLGDTTPTFEGSGTSSGGSGGPLPETSGVVEMAAEDSTAVDQRVGCDVSVYQGTAIE